MHYIYTKEGAAEAMGLRKSMELNYYIKKAKRVGLEPSKMLGGIEYFDLEMLVNPLRYAAQKQKREIEQNISKQLLEHQGESRIQLSLF